MDAKVLEVKFDPADFEGLPIEKQSSVLFAWVSKLTAKVRRLDKLEPEIQQHVTTELGNLLDHFQNQKDQSLFKKGTRNAIGRLYQLMYTNTESTKNLYEAANKLIGYVGKSDKYTELKHLAIVAFGFLFESCGDKIVSLAPMAVMSSIKQLKNSTHTGYKYSLMASLHSITEVTGDSFDDQLSKDIWKTARTNAVDKSAKIASSSFRVLEALAKQRIVFKTASDFESFKSIYLKAIESPFGIVRQSAARCFANACLQLTHLARTKAEFQPPPKKSSKASQDDDMEDAPTRTASPAAAMAKVKSFYSISFPEVLRLFVSCYTLNGISSRSRVGVAQSIAFFILLEDPAEIERRYWEITSYLMDIVTSPGIKLSTYKSLVAKQDIVFILNEIIAKQILGELGKLNVLGVLTNQVLKNYPAVLKDQVEPSPEVLATTCEVVKELIKDLGSGISTSGSEPLKLSLVQLLDHPNYTVQMSACSCLRELVLAVPSHIIPLLTTALNTITKELPLIAKQQANSHRILGQAYLAAILVSLTNTKPEYCSLDLTSRALTTATGLLKVQNVSVDVLAIHVQVAWLLVSGLMPLGPSFVKIHLSQLLLLWKAALYKPVSKDQNPADKSALELSYYLHVRHAALGSIAAFLAYNSKLVTADVSRRIGVLLQNTGIFLNGIPSKKFADTEPQLQLNSNFTLGQYDTMTRRRALQCYLYLSQFSQSSEAFPANLLTSCLSSFADPDKDVAKMSTAIAANAGTIDSLWELADNNAYGVTSKVSGFDIDDLYAKSKATGSDDDDQSLHWLSETLNWCSQLEKNVKSPVVSSIEQDADAAFFLQSDAAAVPAATAVVDLSIDLFTSLLPSQTPKVQESILDQLRTYVIAAKKKTSHRRNAVVVNSAATLYCALKAANKSTHREAFKSPRILNVSVEIIKQLLVDTDPYVRNLSAQAMGMLCSLGGSTTTTEHIKYLIDEIVSNRDPNARGGSSIALGYILKHVGGMFAGLHLKTVLGILTSLATDPHPTVHFWALEAISITIASSGLSFSNYTSSTVSTLVKLFLLESHGDENNSTVSTNLDVDYPTMQIISRCIRALINVFGPDLREASKSRDHVLNLVQQFELSSSDERTLVEAHRSIQELIIFSTDTVNIDAFGRAIHKNVMIVDQFSLLRSAAVDGLYQLIRTISSERVFKHCGSDLETDIWLAYNNSPGQTELRRFVENWLEQTAEHEPILWVTRIQNILSKSKNAFDPHSTKKPVTSAPAKSGDNDAGLIGDEEGKGEGEKSAEGTTSEELLKWQTRELAVILLRKLTYLLLSNKTVAQREQSPLVGKVGDLIRISFNAATAPVLELRLLGMKLLNDILFELKDLVDPDFTEVALLEQYQAQISSALTPAFSGDSSPELAFQAIKVSATFIGSGIIKNVERMGRILKPLTIALESCSTTQSHISLGELKCQSPNAQVMLRIAVLSLWAELQVSSVYSGKEYLVGVVKPHVASLVPLWIASLRDFAKLRFEPEQSSGLSSGGGLSGSLDQMYSALSRSSILPIYQESWLQLVDAIASLIEQDSRMVFDILDEKERATGEEEGIKYSNEPAAFFFVLFGLCFEALVRPQHSMGMSSNSESRLRVLVALKRILHPSVSGNTIYREDVFAETIDMLDRIVLTGSVKEQQAVVDIVTGVCMNHPGRSKSDEEAQSDQISDSVDQLFELFRVVMLAITNMFPFLADSERPISRHTVEDTAHLALVRSCLDSLVSMIGVFPNIIKVDLYSCLLYVFGRFLEHERCQKNIVPYSLVVQKKLLQMMMQTRKTCSTSGPVIESAVTTAITHIVGLLNTADTSESGVAKRKNCILSAVIVLTTCTEALPSQGQYLYDLSGLLVANIRVPKLAQITAECIRTLLVSCIKSGVGKVLAERMIPSLITIASESTEPSAVPKLVNDIMVAFTMAMNSDQVSSGMSVTIPVLIQFIGDKTCGIGPEQRLAYVKEKLIELANHDGESFKKVVKAGLSDWQRTLLEKVLRGDASESASKETEEDSKESETHIQLKSFS